MFDYKTRWFYIYKRSRFARLPLWYGLPDSSKFYGLFSSLCAVLICIKINGILLDENLFFRIFGLVHSNRGTMLLKTYMNQSLKIRLCTI